MDIYQSKPMALICEIFNASGDYVRGGLSASLNPYYVGAEYHFNYDMNQNGSIDDRHNISVEVLLLQKVKPRN